MQQKTLVLFDFDGTLTRGDSLSRFLFFAVPPGKLLAGCILLIFKFLRLAWSGSWTNERAKEMLFSVYFKGYTSEALQQLGSDFSRKKLPRLLRPVLVDQLRTHRNDGATIAVVSASPDLWLRPFCTAEAIQLICTGLRFENGVFTGYFATPNCNGHEKARRIREVFDLTGFERIIAYGNSAGDAEMLALADEAWLIRGVNHTFAPQIHKTAP